MLPVPAGAFTMGSPESEDGHRVWEQQREITFANDFHLGQTPVTQTQYEAITGANPTDHERVGDAPVDSVNWQQASEYCEKLSQLDREAGIIPLDWEYRLPTEAEWEYACRAGTSQPRHGEPDDVAWYHDNSGQKPHPVGLKAPNAWEFHDMLGNIWEWCQDMFWNANPSRSVRGGSYFNSARFCRSAQRWGWMPANRGRYCGFRLLAAPKTSFELSPPVDDFPPQQRPPSIYDAIEANDFALALRLVNADASAIEPVDVVPPPLHSCIYSDRSEWLDWLVEHGADVEHRDQDYGSTPLNCAVVMRHEHAIRTLIRHGADSRGAMDCAQRGLNGAFEDDARLDREGYRAIVALLQELEVGD